MIVGKDFADLFLFGVVGVEGVPSIVVFLLAQDGAILLYAPEGAKPICMLEKMVGMVVVQ